MVILPSSPQIHQVLQILHLILDHLHRSFFFHMLIHIAIFISVSSIFIASFGIVIFWILNFLLSLGMVHLQISSDIHFSYLRSIWLCFCLALSSLSTPLAWSPLLDRPPYSKTSLWSYCPLSPPDSSWCRVSSSNYHQLYFS